MEPEFKDQCRTLLAELQRDVRDSFTIEPSDSGCLIRTSYLFPDNDPIEVFADRSAEGERVRLTDLGETMGLLFLQGVEIRGRSRQEWHLETALRRLDINLDGQELVVDVPLRELGDGLIRLVEGIKALSYLVYTTRARIGPDFKREVSDWLEEERVEFESDYPVSGQSGRIWTIDFTREIGEEPPILMQALHSETVGYAVRLAERTALMWVELSEASPAFHKLSLIDDTIETPVWEEPLPLLRQYSDRVGL